MADLADSLVKHRVRLNEIARVLAHNGLARAARGTGIAGIGPVEQLIDRKMAPEDLEVSDGGTAWNALTELGTTWTVRSDALSSAP
jgi:hypothetical protein